MDRAYAEHFAAEWIAAWNAHDLPRVLSHYADDFEMASPYIVTIAGEPSGRLRGKQAVGAYWAAALQRNPDLHFSLQQLYLGVDSLTICYTRAAGAAAEVFRFNADGLVVSAAAHYA